MVDPLPGDTAGGEPRSLRAGLDAVLRRLGSAPVSSVTELIEAWPRLVGVEVAARSRPLRLAASTLVVEVEEPALVSHLTWQETALCREIRSLLESDEPTSLDVVVRRG